MGQREGIREVYQRNGHHMSQMLCVEANMVGVTLPCHLWTSLSFVSRKEWVKLANCCNIYY